MFRQCLNVLEILSLELCKRDAIDFFAVRHLQKSVLMPSERQEFRFAQITRLRASSKLFSAKPEIAMKRIAHHFQIDALAHFDGRIFCSSAHMETCTKLAQIGKSKNGIFKGLNACGPYRFAQKEIKKAPESFL